MLRLDVSLPPRRLWPADHGAGGERGTGLLLLSSVLATALVEQPWRDVQLALAGSAGNLNVLLRSVSGKCVPTQRLPSTSPSLAGWPADGPWLPGLPRLASPLAQLVRHWKAARPSLLGPALSRAQPMPGLLLSAGLGSTSCPRF